MPSPLLFSDVDGTLLDAHGRYAMTARELSPFLPHFTLVLASSRTILELSRNQRDLGIDGPVVAENGAVVGLPWDESLSEVGVRESIDEREWCVVVLGTPATTLRRDVQEVARSLGVVYVDQDDVESSLGRRSSVLLRPVAGTDESTLDPLAQALRARGHAVASGGAWLAVTGRADKGRGVRAVIDCEQRLGRDYSLVAAVGDGDNDVPLFLACKRRFAIARDDGTWHSALRALPDVECVLPPGIDGWREVVRRLAQPQEDR